MFWPEDLWFAIAKYLCKLDFIDKFAKLHPAYDMERFVSENMEWFNEHGHDCFSKTSNNWKNIQKHPNPLDHWTPFELVRCLTLKQFTHIIERKDLASKDTFEEDVKEFRFAIQRLGRFDLLKYFVEYCRLHDASFEPVDKQEQLYDIYNVDHYQYLQCAIELGYVPTAGDIRNCYEVEALQCLKVLLDFKPQIIVTPFSISLYRRQVDVDLCGSLLYDRGYISMSQDDAISLYTISETVARRLSITYANAEEDLDDYGMILHSCQHFESRSSSFSSVLRPETLYRQITKKYDWFNRSFAHFCQEIAIYYRAVKLLKVLQKMKHTTIESPQILLAIRRNSRLCLKGMLIDVQASDFPFCDTLFFQAMILDHFECFEMLMKSNLQANLENLRLIAKSRNMNRYEHLIHTHLHAIGV
jgi:hypothetical protein